LDAIVANAAVYKPLLTEPERTAEGFELCVGTNHLGHFLLLNLLMDDLSQSKNEPRCVILGTVTHNPNELGGKIPPQANLGDLSGLAKGVKGPISMIDGKEFSAPKAYKDSKVCNILTMKEMAKRFSKEKGIIFSSLYPGCVATTPLFRNHLPLFQFLFPLFQKNITGAFVTEELAGNRVADLVTEDKYKQSGAYWSWGGRGSSGRNESFVQ
jgi:protochlorophyllide reductase